MFTKPFAGSRTRQLWRTLLLLGALTALAAPLAWPASAAAHVRGKPSFLTINKSFVDYYNVKPFDGAKHNYPQSMDVNFHIPSEPLTFKINKQLFAVSYDNVDAMQLSWDFGDGSAPQSGFETSHSYAAAGTYIVGVHGSTPGGQPQLVESTFVQVVPSKPFRLINFTMLVDDMEVFNNTQKLDIRPGQTVKFGIKQYDQIAADKVEWDFGDGTTSSGPDASHAYGKDFAEAMPVVRVHYGDVFFLDKQLWLHNPDGRPAPGTQAPASDTTSLTGRTRHYLQDKLDGIFANGATNYALAIFVLLFAALAGALHSLTPGHGKTILAALLVGRDGNRYRDLAILTASVTIAHTIVIYGIGFVLLAVSRSRSANSLLPYFEWASATLVIMLALYLIGLGIRRIRHGHAHHHHNHDHTHHHTAVPAAASPNNRAVWSLVVAGASGGIVPCVDALSLLLLAASLGHVGFGLVLVVFFSLGLAGTIAVLGLAVIAGRNRIKLSTSTEQRVALYAPLVSGCIILLLAVFTLIP